MKVVVLGGYGVFGSRLAELLIRDGHDVWVAGRDLGKATALAARLGALPLRVDRNRAPEAIFAPAPDCVIDAAGPFQAYGGDPYRLARLAMARGADYLDLSDDADFTAGIGALDAEARNTGRRVLSGVSSVPALSSIVAAELARGFDETLLIDTAILPGNRAPRGASVIAGIVGQTGAPARVWRGGVWRDARGWSDRRRIRLGPDLARSAYFISVPDIRLFPAFFRARSVMFRAGMELETLNLGLRVLGRLRRVWPVKVTPRRARVLQWLANLALPFGTDRGGMRVAVTGRIGDDVRMREWRLIAEAGDGPFIPGIAARTLLRDMDRIAPGARPALSETGLRDIEDAMSDLSVSTATVETPRPTLFQTALGDRWALLPQAVRDLHSVQDQESFSGVAEVTRGRSLIARLAAWVFGFPAEGRDVPLTITKTRTDEGETWKRNFNGKVFRSYCTPSPSPHRYRERFWWFKYEQDLPVADGAMRLPVRAGRFLGLPLPRAFLPTSDSREYAEDGVFHFDVALGAPLGGGLIVRYRGALRPDRAPPE